MDINEPIIHPLGDTKTLTSNEHKNSLDPYEQQVDLFSHMEAWCRHAVEVLTAKSFSGFSYYGSGVYKLMWIPESITTEGSVDLKTQAADNVLRAIHELHEAIFQGDKLRIANIGIQLGVAVSIAHSRPYEVIALYGREKKEGERRGGQASKESKGVKEKLKQIIQLAKQSNPDKSKS